MPKHHKKQNVKKTTNPQVDHFNTILDQARESVSCDAACQYRKKAQDLKDKYMNMLQGEKTLPEDLRKAEKNYIVFTKGQNAYNDVLDNQLKNKAQQITSTILDNFNKDGNKITTDINSYNVLLLNYKNVLDLYKRYKSENDELKKNIQEEGNDILTNERKTYYENEGYTTLNTFYYVLTIIYIIVLIVFLGSIFMFPSEMKMMVKFGILFGLIILYFISPYLLSTIVSIVYFIYNKLPKNVHLTI